MRVSRLPLQWLQTRKKSCINEKRSIFMQPLPEKLHKKIVKKFLKLLMFRLRLFTYTHV